MQKITNIISTELLKIITMIILLMGTWIKASAQSPYAMFGDNSKMLEAKSEPVPSIYRVGIQSPLDNRASFTTTLSGKRNFRDVDIYGQTNFSYPSTSSSSRKTSTGMLMGKFSVPTYMVGCDRGNGLRSYFVGTSISPMRKSRNGRGQ